MDPVLQFQPWLEFNRRMIRSGRLPLWNGSCRLRCASPGQRPERGLRPVPSAGVPGADAAGAYAWIAAGRLWVAGLGMFLLARVVGAGLLGPLVRGAGLSVLRLPRPLAALPGHGRRDLDALAVPGDRPGVSRSRGPARPAGWPSWSRLSSWAGTFRPARTCCSPAGCTRWPRLAGERGERIRPRRGRRSAGRWERAWAWALAAVQILPLGFYLAKSPVWSDRQRERPAWWVIDRPRLLDVVCTAAPYAYGSQRRGHPNLARALGVHNLNESAGGLRRAGHLDLAGPAGRRHARRDASRRVPGRAVVFGAMGAFRWPPVDNLLRALPVLDVTDNRRLTLWVAFGLTLLGGIGLDQLGRVAPAAALVDRGVGRRGRCFWARRPARSARSSGSSGSGP